MRASGVYEFLVAALWEALSQDAAPSPPTPAQWLPRDLP